jgi:ketosteroid isomerase-like protein
VAVVQRAFVAWNTGDFDAVVADSASDVVWNLSRIDNWTERDSYSGLVELRAFWDLWLGAWVDHHLELLELLAKDDKVFCRYRQTATGKASGASVEVEDGQVITFRDGKVIRTDVYSGPAEAAQAAGVRL